MKTVAISLSLLLLICAAFAADQPRTEKPKSNDSQSPEAVADTRTADEAAVRAAGAEFIDAYNARDAKRLAAQWSPEAIYIDPLTGEQTVGRDAIEKVFEEAFADKKDIKLEIDVASIDFVSPNVAIMRGVVHVI